MLGPDGEAVSRRLQQQLAEGLRAGGWTQEQIGAWLGCSQSSISRLLQRPRAALPPSIESALAGLVEPLVATALVAGDAHVVRQRWQIELELADGSQVQAVADWRTADEAATLAALSAGLEQAARALDAERLAPLFPAVGLNLVALPPAASAAEEAVAFPGRVQWLDGRLRWLEPPRPGASRHLAGLLLAVAEAGSPMRCALNLRPPNGPAEQITAWAAAAAAALGWRLALAPRGVAGAGADHADVLVDVGDHGWEPALYPLATTPADLVTRTHQLLDVLLHPTEAI